MRIVFGCVFGWVLTAITLGVAGWEALAPRPPGGGPLRPAGQLWFDLDPASLNLVQAVIERYVWAPLWDPILSSLLQLPAVLVFAVPAGGLVLLCHWRRLRARRVE